MRTRPQFLATAVIILTTLPLLSACVAPAPDAPTPVAPPREGITGQISGERSDAPDPQSCPTPTLDLVETSFGRYTPLGRVPTGTSGVWFNFRVVDNSFDPCLPLSWIVLSGTNGDHVQPLGSPATAAEAVVFFHYDAPVSMPPPVQFHEIRTVERVNHNAVAVTYGHAAGATAEGVTETFTTTHSWEEGPVTTGPGAEAYEAAATQVLTLDLDAPRPTTPRRSCWAMSGTHAWPPSTTWRNARRR